MLMFTAPYKLCEGGCDQEQKNFVISFPLFIGKGAKEAYKKNYDRDYKKIHFLNKNAPFKFRTTRTPHKLLLINECESSSTSTTTAFNEYVEQRKNTEETVVTEGCCDPECLISMCPDLKAKLCTESSTQQTSPITTSTIPPIIYGHSKDPIHEIQKNLRTADDLIKSMMRRRKTISYTSFSITRKTETTVSDIFLNDDFIYENSYERPLPYRTYKTLGPFKRIKK